MPTATLRAVGRYRLETLIGRGGMAEVYRAVDSRLDRPVAVKMILPGLLSRPTVLARFLREARTVAALEHPSILPIYDFGEEDGIPYLVMPLMTGGTLAERIGSAGLPRGTVAGWVGQLGDALDTAHAAGILHRDVKASNVLMDRKDRPVLSDFGLARSAGASSDLTLAGTLVGTPSLLAPELIQGGSASTATDLYALGVLTYQMLSGTMPFEGEGARDVLRAHVGREIPSITARVPELPAALEAFFARALAKLPEARFPSGAELARELGRSLGVLRPDEATSTSTPPTEHRDAESTSDALLEGAVSVTPVPDEPPPPVLPAPARTASRGAWTFAFVIVFAALGVLLGSRSLLGRSAHPAPRKEHAPMPAGSDAGAAGTAPASLRLRPRLAQLLMLHRAGRHDEAAAAALALSAEVPADDPEALGRVLRIAGDESAELGRWLDAVEAYRRAAGTGGPVALHAALEGARIALEELGDRGTARELYATACDGGSALACRRASALEGGGG